MSTKAVRKPVLPPPPLPGADRLERETMLAAILLAPQWRPNIHPQTPEHIELVTKARLVARLLIEGER